MFEDILFAPQNIFRDIKFIWLVFAYARKKNKRKIMGENLGHKIIKKI